MWWGILTVVVVVALVVVWLVLQHQTDLLGRSRRHEATDPEVARALREARRDVDRGNQYPRRVLTRTDVGASPGRSEKVAACHVARPRSTSCTSAPR